MQRRKRTTNVLQREPILTALVVPLLIGLLARFGFNLDEDTAFQIAGGLWAVGALVVRTWFATPTADPHDNAKRPLVPATAGAPPATVTPHRMRQRRRE